MSRYADEFPATRFAHIPFDSADDLLAAMAGHRYSDEPAYYANEATLNPVLGTDTRDALLRLPEPRIYRLHNLRSRPAVGDRCPDCGEIVEHLCYLCSRHATSVIQNAAKLRRYACDEHMDRMAGSIAALGEATWIVDL